MYLDPTKLKRFGKAVVVHAGTIAMIRNALERDAVERPVRGEMLQMLLDNSAPVEDVAGNYPSGYVPGEGFFLDAANEAELAAYDHAVYGMIAAVNDILDGRDDGRGTSNEPWESLRRRLIAFINEGENHVVS